MSLLKSLIGIHTIKKPTFYKDFEYNTEREEELLSLSEEVEEKNKLRDIKSEVYAMRKGAKGEKAVAYELKNSYVPMICLHDIRLEFDDKIAQYDFILLTHCFVMVLETKALSCDVNINQYGEFERVIKLKNGNSYRKGMYSPITQNDRHVKILKDFFMQNKVAKRIPIYSAVIIANEEALINRRYAKKEVSEKIYKIDQLTNLLEKTIEKEKKNGETSEQKLVNIANLLAENNKPIKINYKAKFGITENKKENLEKKEEKVHEIIKDIRGKLKEANEEVVEKNKEVNLDEKIRERLIVYRRECYIREHIKAYNVFKNETMENIIKEKPRDLAGLQNIQGVGKNTIDKYGEDIIKIVNNIV